MSDSSPDKPDEQVFEDKARKILDYLRRDIRYGGSIPRPFFIEFFGSPSAGKTTTITEADKFLRRQGFRVFRPQEGAEVIRHIERDTPLYNLRTALYAMNILIDQSAGHLYDIIIFDRCLYDAYCWMLYWQEKNKLTSEEVAIFQSFFTSRFWIDKIDIAYLMTCEAETAMERELRIALSSKLGETTNPETIKKLIARCNRTFQTLSSKRPELRIFDTTKMNEQEMVQKIAEDILSSLIRKITKK